MVVPNSGLRVALAISALLAALMVGGAGVGIAAADPPDPGGPDSTSGPSTGSQAEPTSAAPTPAPAVPRTVIGVLHDLLHRPVSIFGNGRLPGDPPNVGGTGPGGATTPTRGRPRDKPTTKPAPMDGEPELDPVVMSPNPVVPRSQWSSSIDVLLPFSPPVAVALPPVLVPGYENLRLTLDLTDPNAAFASLQETTDTINSLLADAYAPYNPFTPPAPEPQPTFKILEEEPVVEAGGGIATPVAAPAAGPAGDLPVLRAPAMLPPVRIALPRPIGPPRPIADATPADSVGRVPGSGPAEVSGPAPRGPAGSSADAASSALGRPTPRQGYQQYLRSAGPAQVAAIAVPGLIGLLALTVSGIVTGYRQANSQRFVRAEAARFLR